MYPLHPGDIVDLIAPSSKKKTPEGSQELLSTAIGAAEKWGLTPRHSAQIFGNHALYAAPTDQRFTNFVEAAYAPDSHVLWALRGGSGATRLIPLLHKLPKPAHRKTLIGFSDITALHLFVHQSWGWTAIHGPVLGHVGTKELDESTVALIRDLVFGDLSKVVLDDLRPLNQLAEEVASLTAPLTGGNLSLIQYSLGTSWQVHSKGHILFLEDINEPAYRTAERLEHLRQAGVFQGAMGILLGGFTFLKEDMRAEEAFLYPEMLREFSRSVQIPVFMSDQFGHDRQNRPLILGARGVIKKENKTYHLTLPVSYEKNPAKAGQEQVETR